MVILLSALTTPISLVWAEGGSMSGDTTSSNEQSGMVAPKTDAEQPSKVESGRSDESSVSEVKSASRPGMSDKDLKADAAKMSLAPHSIAVETSLLSAIDQIKGLKAQVKTAQNQPTAEFMDHYKFHTREMKDSLKNVKTHEAQLKSSASKFPNVAQSDQFRQMAPALNDVERLSSQWEKQSASQGYWRDASKVTSDLNQLERRLTTALEKTKSFNSHIDVSDIG